VIPQNIAIVADWLAKEFNLSQNEAIRAAYSLVEHLNDEDHDVTSTEDDE